MAGGDIHAAALQGDIAAVRELIDKRDDRMEAGGYTPLGLAVSAGHVEIVRLLLRETVTVDAADDEGVTALMHAAMHGYGALVDLLLLHGASPLKTRNDGESAHTLAALYGRPAALGAFFRANGALVETPNALGRTPLHNAVTLRHLITIKYLIGADHPTSRVSNPVWVQSRGWCGTRRVAGRPHRRGQRRQLSAAPLPRARRGARPAAARKRLPPLPRRIQPGRPHPTRGGCGGGARSTAPPTEIRTLTGFDTREVWY